MGVVGTKFAEKHLPELSQFIYKALQKCYGSEAATGDENNLSGSTKYACKNGDWNFTDNFYGGEPFSGMSTVFYRGISCWNMCYYGKVFPFVEDIQRVYDCLFPALMEASKEYPFRGPHKFVSKEGLTYENTWEGVLASFTGRERITDIDGTCLFETYYAGGLVNIRPS